MKFRISLFRISRRMIDSSDEFEARYRLRELLRYIDFSRRRRRSRTIRVTDYRTFVSLPSTFALHLRPFYHAPLSPFSLPSLDVVRPTNFNIDFRSVESFTRTTSSKDDQELRSCNLSHESSSYELRKRRNNSCLDYDRILRTSLDDD